MPLPSTEPTAKGTNYNNTKKGRTVLDALIQRTVPKFGFGFIFITFVSYHPISIITLLKMVFRHRYVKSKSTFQRHIAVAQMDQNNQANAFLAN